MEIVFPPIFLGSKNNQTKQQESLVGLRIGISPNKNPSLGRWWFEAYHNLKKNMHKSKLRIFNHSSRVTLQGINIYPTKALLKMSFLFPRRDMRVS